MEDDTWQPGTVARVHVEHEGGTAPFAVQLDRGDAVIAPADEERFIRPLGGLRFRVGDRVECHVEDDRWAAGMWSGANPKPKPKPKPIPSPSQRVRGVYRLKSDGARPACQLRSCPCRWACRWRCSDAARGKPKGRGRYGTEQ